MSARKGITQISTLIGLASQWFSLAIKDRLDKNDCNVIIMKYLKKIDLTSMQSQSPYIEFGTRWVYYYLIITCLNHAAVLIEGRIQHF